MHSTPSVKSRCRALLTNQNISGEFSRKWVGCEFGIGVKDWSEVTPRDLFTRIRTRCHLMGSHQPTNQKIRASGQVGWFLMRRERTDRDARLDHLAIYCQVRGRQNFLKEEIELVPMMVLPWCSRRNCGSVFLILSNIGT